MAVLLIALLYAAIMAQNLYLTYRRERAEDPGTHPRYEAPFASFNTFKFFLVWTVGTILMTFARAGSILNGLNALFFSLMLQFSLIYGLLLLLTPVLRAHFHPHTCAFLWFLPYLLFMVQNVVLPFLPLPRFLIPVDRDLFVRLFLLWAAGAAAVLLWKVAGHIRFTQSVLQEEIPVTDPLILDLWAMELDAANLEDFPCKLVYSNKVRTPISFGFRPEAARVVLPAREYEPEDLSLILRHELIHLSRRDNLTKLLFTIFTALGWFNPLMWMGTRRMAQDLELSCDQAVLRTEDGPTRKRYAQLLLNTAGEQRGFTTCMSAAAQTFRYRLKHTLIPEKRRDGIVLAAVCSVLVVLSALQPFALAFHSGTLEELVLPEGTAYQVEISYPDFGEAFPPPQDPDSITCTDPEALLDYLCSQQADEVYAVELPRTGPYLALCLSGSGGEFRVHISHRIVSVDEKYYLLREELDWAYLHSLLDYIPQ